MEPQMNADRRRLKNFRFEIFNLRSSASIRGSNVPSAIYLTECTWMRKRGLRTAEWKIIVACEPDIHGFPPVELYDLRSDPAETRNLAEARPEVVARLRGELRGWVERRTRETGLPDPIEEQPITLRQIGAPKKER